MALDTFVPPFTISARAIQVSGTTWAQYRTGGPAIVLANLIAANPALADPTTTATTASSVASSSLPVGTGYKVSYSWVGLLGETLVGGISAAFNQVDSSHLLTVTIPALPTGAVSANLYLLDPATSTTKLYATGLTGLTFGMSFALPPDQPGAKVPPSNTTGGAAHAAMLNSVLLNQLTEYTAARFSDEASNYLSGLPIERREIFRQHRRWTGVHAYWYQLSSEIETLIAANMPTAVAFPVSAIGFPQFKNTLP